MDKIVSQIQALSSTEADLKQLRTNLQKGEEVIVKNINVVDDVLAQLDPSLFGLGWTFLLSIKASVPRIPEPPRFLAQCTNLFLHALPDQIRLEPKRFARIARRYMEIAIEQKQVTRTILPLKFAVVKCRASPEQITPIHPDFLQMCILAKNYKAAVPILEDEVFEIEPGTTGLQPRDLLRYFYYGGMIYTGLKEFRKAFDFFKLTFTAPAVLLSAVMVESYKKYVLLSLLVYGQIQPLPKYTSGIIQRHLKTLTTPYHEFANAFSTYSTDEIHKVATTHAEVFSKDKNFGLVKQCIQTLYKRNIQRSTQTYLTISLGDIADSVKLTGPKEAEKRILRMIESGEVYATINQANGMVSFQEDPEKYDTNRMLSNIDSQVKRVAEMTGRLKRLDQSIALTPQYVQRTTAHERHSRFAGGLDSDMDQTMDFDQRPGKGFVK
jgi:COP9 signalosome complex subunit 3